jgi:hypothetical protein
MTNNDSYYHELNGSYVIVNTRSMTFVGRLEADNFDTLRLRPSIVHEPRIHMKEGEMKNVPHYRLETNKPTIINTIEVQTVQPTTEDHVREIADYDSKNKSGGEKR